MLAACHASLTVCSPCALYFETERRCEAYRMHCQGGSKSHLIKWGLHPTLSHSAAHFSSCVSQFSARSIRSIELSILAYHACLKASLGSTWLSAIIAILMCSKTGYHSCKDLPGRC
ncbi:hypothetical protein HZ326_7572 [Fusarium oxysporum f. sp. albedinis]|nr:hypothetical protein HZ326_7572 [Fusarium oxysporum f. sp. albedinis]